jgi:predicted dienelactone hydrolase
LHVYLVMKMYPSLTLQLLAVALPLSLAAGGGARASGYDPLTVNAAGRPSHLDLTTHDGARNRDIPLRVYLPANSAPAPVILFSHDLGGSRTGSAFLGEHWAARGYTKRG